MSTDDLGFVPVSKIGDDEERGDVFSELLKGTDDDERAVEQTDDDLGTLEQEWEKLCNLKAARDIASQAEKDAKATYAVQQGRMADAMERQGVKQFRGSNGGGCTVTDTYTTAIEDEQVFMGWVKETHPELLTVNSMSRTKFIREEYRDKGIPQDDPSFPPGLRSDTIHPLQVRGARPAEKQGD